MQTESATITLLNKILSILMGKVKVPMYMTVTELAVHFFGDKGKRNKVTKIIWQEEVPVYLRQYGLDYYMTSEFDAAIRSTRWKAA